MLAIVREAMPEPLSRFSAAMPDNVSTSMTDGETDSGGVGVVSHPPACEVTHGIGAA